MKILKNGSKKTVYTVGELWAALKTLDEDMRLDGGMDGPLTLSVWVEEDGTEILTVEEDCL